MQKVHVDHLIIGAGLVGSTIYRALEKLHPDLSVAILDSNEHYAASKCSLGVWKDGWIGGIKDKATESLEFLDKVLDIQPKQRSFYNMDNDTVETFDYIKRSKLLIDDPIPLKVTKCALDTTPVQVYTDEYLFVVKGQILVCSGAYTPMVLTQMGINGVVPIDSYWGADFKYMGDLGENRVVTWAPYKQVVAHQVNKKEFQFSDGTTVKNPKPNDPRVAKATERLLHHFNEYIGVSFDESKCHGVLEGLRPYLKNKSEDLVQRVHPNVIVATGGAKNTTVLSGYFAKKALELMGL